MALLFLPHNVTLLLVAGKGFFIAAASSTEVCEDPGSFAFILREEIK